MTNSSLIVKNCKIISNDGTERLTDILINNGTIAEINDKIDINKVLQKLPKGTMINTIDAHDNYVLPGVVDVHTHMRDMGLSHKEDYTTGSMACARGGVTTFIDMPNTIPNTTTIQALQDKRSKIKGNSYVDYGFHFGGSRSDNSSEIIKAKDECASTKLFMNISTGDMLIEDDVTLENIFKNSKIVSVHAEGEMVEKAIKLSDKTGTPLYLCHLSTAQEIHMLTLAKEKGSKVYGEVTPHHLFLNKDNMEKDKDTRQLLRMKPELKEESDNDALWEALRDRIIDTVGTDHAPHLLSEKYAKLTFGIPSVENSLEIMLKGVLDNKITMKRLTEVMSSSPSGIFKIKNKGEIKVGNDGDLVIIDINDHSVITNDTVISKSGWTPYNGVSRGGKVLTTIVRGNIVYDHDKFYDKIGEEVKYYD